MLKKAVKFELKNNRKEFLVDLKGLLRSLGSESETTEGAMEYSVMDCIRIGMVSPLVSGEVTLKTNSNKDCYFFVEDDSTLHVVLRNLTEGGHRVTIYAKYGTNTGSMLTIDVHVPNIIDAGYDEPVVELDMDAVSTIYVKDEEAREVGSEAQLPFIAGLDTDGSPLKIASTNFRPTRSITDESEMESVAGFDANGNRVKLPRKKLGEAREITDGAMMAFITGLDDNGDNVKITLDNFGKEEILHELAWGVKINPNSSSPHCVAVGNHDEWEAFKEHIGRYLVKADGSKAIKLDSHDSTKSIDGETIDETLGHVMVRIPTIHYKVVTASDGTVTLWMSANEIGGHVMPEQWIGAYLAYETGGKLTSRSGVKPSASRTINTFWSQAQANGHNFGLVDYKARQAMMMIYLSEYLSLDSQSTLGFGMANNSWYWGEHVSDKLTGKTSELGDKCGNVADAYDEAPNAAHVSLFGIEDPYAWYWEFTQGVFFGNSENTLQEGTEAFLYEGNRMPNGMELLTRPSGEYRQLVRPTSSGWVKAMLLGERFDIIPKTLGGSSATYWCDYHYANNTGQVLLWGGDAFSGSYCGLVFSCSSNGWTYAYSGFGSRLALYSAPALVQEYTEIQ